MPVLTPATVGVLLFAGLLGLSLSMVYFLVAAPAARRARRGRLATVQRGLNPVAEELTDLRRRARLAPPTAFIRFPGAARLERRMGQAGMTLAPEMLLSLCLGCGAVALLVAAALGQPFAGAALAALGAAALPLLYVSFRRARRLSSFEEQFPDAIDLLGRAVRAGHAFTTGFELIAREMPDPMAGEFQVVFDQQNLGLPLRDALDGLVARVPSADVKVFVSALQIQRDTGGNLAEILQKLSEVVRERFKLRRQVKVFTAEGRMSLYALTGAPIFTAAVLYFVNRAYVMPLVTDPTGQRMTWGAVGLLAAGYYVIRRMVNLKV